MEILRTLFDRAMIDGKENVTLKSLSDEMGKKPGFVSHALHVLGIKTTERKRVGDKRVIYVVFDENWEVAYRGLLSNEDRYQTLFYVVTTCPECDKKTLVRRQNITFDGPVVEYRCSTCSHHVVYPIIKGELMNKKRNETVPAIRIKCPYCSKMHKHSSKPLPGLRRSHCTPGPIPPGNFPDPYPSDRCYWIEVEE